MTKPEERLSDFADDECSFCGGDGFMVGGDMPGFDFINDDPDDIYRCPSCNGSGFKKDQTIF